MALKDYLKDLTTYVASTGFFERIKITASSQEIQIESMTKEKEIILKGKFNTTLADLNGEFGLSNLSLLQTITSDPEYLLDETTVSVEYEIQHGEKVPSEITYQNKSNSHINYRFMPKQLVPDQPKFNEPKWDIVIKPNRSSIQQFGWAANGLAAYEQYFIPKITDGNLRFYIGDESASTQRGGVVFATDLKEKFESPHKWKIQLLQGILKLASTCDCEMSFSSKGAIQVKLQTGIGTYNYIFPAKVR